MSDTDIFEGLEGEDAFLDPSPNSTGSTPIEFSGVDGQAPPILLPSVTSNGSGFTCPDCNKTIKTKSGFARHMMVHRLNDYNSRKPLEEEVRRDFQSTFQIVLEEIRGEPAVGDMGETKKKFVEKLLPLVGMPGCLDFMAAVLDPLIDCVLSRSKVMPSAQYEAALAKLNSLLASGDFCNPLKEKLLLSVPLEDRNISSEVCQRLVWRIVTLSMSRVQESVFRKMKAVNESTQNSFVMSENHLVAFKEHIGSLLRSIYRIGDKSKSIGWASRCLALRERFVICDLVNREKFLDRNLWESGSILLSDACVNLFLGLERLVQSLKGQMCTAEIVFNSLTNAENNILLNYMRTLSRGCLSEETALDFLKVIISSFISTSCRFEAKKITSVKRADVALRHDLKRNPRKKKQVSQACEDESTPSTSRGQTSTLGNIAVAAPKKVATPSSSSRKKAKPTDTVAAHGKGQRESTSRSKKVKPQPVTKKASSSSKKTEQASGPMLVAKPSPTSKPKPQPTSVPVNPSEKIEKRRTRSSAALEQQIPQRRTRK